MAIISQASITISEIKALAKKRRKYGDFWQKLKQEMRNRGFIFSKYMRDGDREYARCHIYRKGDELIHELHRDKVRKKPGKEE